jgi:hypothetical protein
MTGAGNDIEECPGRQLNAREGSLAPRYWAGRAPLANSAETRSVPAVISPMMPEYASIEIFIVGITGTFSGSAKYEGQTSRIHS